MSAPKEKESSTSLDELRHTNHSAITSSRLPKATYVVWLARYLRMLKPSSPAPATRLPRSFRLAPC